MSRVPWAWSSSLLTETQLQGHVFVRATFPWKRNCFIVSGRANTEYHPTRRVTRQRAGTSRRFAGAEGRLRGFPRAALVRPLPAPERRVADQRAI